MNATSGDQPARIPTADLGSVFSAPHRAEGLAGRLPARPRPAAPPPASEPQAPSAEHVAPPEVQPPSRSKTGPRLKKPPAAAAKKAASAEAGPFATAGIYLPSSLRDRLRQAAMGGLNQTGVILMAVDATHEQLATEFESQRPTASLFSGNPQRERRRRGLDEPLVQLSFRILEADLAVIDQLSETIHAPSRSALISRALDLYLPNSTNV